MLRNFHKVKINRVDAKMWFSAIYRGLTSTDNYIHHLIASYGAHLRMYIPQMKRKVGKSEWSPSTTS